MNIRRLSRTIIYSTAALLSVLLGVACSESNVGGSDEPSFEEGIPTDVRILLSSRASNYTRADGNPKDPNSSIEYMHNWWIVLVDTKGNTTLLKRDDEEKVNIVTAGSAPANANGGFEIETFKTVIPSGTYDIYAFANIDYSATNLSAFVNSLATARKTATSKDAAINAIKEAMKTIRLNSTFETGNMTWSKSANIPMTGYLLGAQVRNTIEEAFSIEVIRAVAKVEFTIDNPTDDYIKLKGLGFERITTSDISLFPDYSAIGLQAFSPFEPLDEEGHKISASYGTLTLDNYLNPAELVKNNPCKFFFYCKESLGQTYEGVDDESFMITLTVDRKRANETEMETDVPRVFYTNTSNIKNYINRNDWIDIRISFNDWKIFWKLHFYPPIGGYPPVFDQNKDGSSLSATLTTGGEFELYPYKIEKNGINYDLSKIDWNTVTVSSIDPKGLFITAPNKVDNPGNQDPHPVSSDKIIAGELDPKKTGDAQVKITFKLKDNEGSSTGFPCTFNIKRENPASAGSDSNDDNTET